MKFLNQLNEALRNIPDLPGEDEWGDPNIDIWIRFNTDVHNKESAEQEAMKLIKINWKDLRSFVRDSSTVFPIIKDRPWPLTGQIQMMAYSNYPEKYDPESDRTIRQKGLIIKIASMVD